MIGARRSASEGRVRGSTSSTIGALQATQSESAGTQHPAIEQALRELSIPISFLRPGWFMENSSWDVAPAAKSGVIASFLQPLHKLRTDGCQRSRHRATRRPARFQETWSGHRIVELEGPHRVTPNEIAAYFYKTARPLLLRVEAVPRETWESLFKSQGDERTLRRAFRCSMAFNEGWIEFGGWSSRLPQRKCRNGNCVANTHRART